MTHEQLLKLIRYVPETGKFFRPDNDTNPLGYMTKTGLMMIGRGKLRLPQAKLAWFYMIGELPEEEIVHANGDRSDMRWANLKIIEPPNQPTGVYLHEQSGKWTASMKANGERIHLGLFLNRETANEAYNKTIRELRIRGITG